jgi:hypothetical protein
VNFNEVIVVIHGPQTTKVFRLFDQYLSLWLSKKLGCSFCLARQTICKQIFEMAATKIGRVDDTSDECNAKPIIEKT